MNLKIDTEFCGLIPPLSAEERQELERSILDNGYHQHDPIIVWDGTIVDGHNRYEICSGKNEDGVMIEFTTAEHDFQDYEEAKRWILRRQLSRRNLSDRARIRLNKRYREMLGERRGRPAKNPTSTIGEPPLEEIPTSLKEFNGSAAGRETTSLIAEKAEVSRAKVVKDDTIESIGDKRLDDGLDDGTFSWDNAYHLALVAKRCGPATYEAAWETEDRIEKENGRVENVRYSTAQLKHLLKLASTGNEDEVTADLIEIVESGQPNPSNGKPIRSVQEAHKVRQKEREPEEDSTDAEKAWKNFTGIMNRLHELAAGVDHAGGIHKILRRQPKQNQRIFVNNYRDLAERALRQVEDFEQSEGR